MEGAASIYTGHHIPLRGALYPHVREQLDMLWKDIDAGLFGETAKTGSFYTSIKAIKDAHPKGAVME